jgi:hypothetical protein
VEVLALGSIFESATIKLRVQSARVNLIFARVFIYNLAMSTTMMGISNEHGFETNTHANIEQKSSTASSTSTSLDEKNGMIGLDAGCG